MFEAIEPRTGFIRRRGIEGLKSPLADLRFTPALFMILKEPISWYLAPRVACLGYPIRIETGIIPIIEYDFAALLSLSSGFNIEVLQMNNDDRVYHLMLAPEISLSSTYESRTGLAIKMLCVAVYISVVF